MAKSKSENQKRTKMNNGKNLEEKAMLTMDELSQYTGFSKGTIYQLTHFKKIPYSKPLGGKLFFQMKDVQNFLKQNRVASNDEIERKATKHSLPA